MKGTRELVKVSDLSVGKGQLEGGRYDKEIKCAFHLQGKSLQNCSFKNSFDIVNSQTNLFGGNIT